MKQLHRPDLFGWSQFDEARNLDFHSVCWVRSSGNVLVDPLPPSDHDLRHLRSLGGARLIVLTNGDHLRGAAALAETFGAKLIAPRGERATLGAKVDEWVGGGVELVPGLRTLELEGSKTPGELALTEMVSRGRSKALRMST